MYLLLLILLFRLIKKNTVKGIPNVKIGTVRKSKKLVNEPIIKNNSEKSFILSYLYIKTILASIVIKNILLPCKEIPM